MTTILDHNTKNKILDHLSSFITPGRLKLFDRIIQDRTRYLTVVLEDIFQPHNASAVLRTCDCFGIQDVHIIENKNTYEVNPDVALGASKWLNLIKYNSSKENTLLAYQTLKDQGYSIIATSPNKGDYLLEELPVDKKAALVFGTELQGLSAEAISHADAFVKIPMYGFTESFNISVSAAIMLHYLTNKIRKTDVDWCLSKEEITTIKLEWMRNTLKRSDLIEKKFLKFSSIYKILT